MEPLAPQDEVPVRATMNRERESVYMYRYRWLPLHVTVDVCGERRGKGDGGKG